MAQRMARRRPAYKVMELKREEAECILLFGKVKRYWLFLGYLDLILIYIYKVV
jgi:hypothetical protein